MACRVRVRRELSVLFYKHTRKGQGRISKGGFKGSETGMGEEAAKVNFTVGVILKMPPNYIAEPS